MKLRVISSLAVLVFAGVGYAAELLPNDLKPVEQILMATVDRHQDEFELTWDLLDLEGIVYPYEVDTRLIKLEADRVASSAAITRAFRYRELDNWSRRRKRQRYVLKALFASERPFFCYNFKELRELVERGENYTGQDCARLTKKLVRKLLKHDLRQSILFIENNFYGPGYEVYLYFNSKQDPTKVLRIYFDVKHEV